MINYPNGKKTNSINKRSDEKRKTHRFFYSGNRGMSLEEDINQSNEYYKSRNIAFILKRPTPINVVKVDYAHGARITDAYFEKQSTTDYNGVYKGRYIDFEAKSTQSKTSFPLANIHQHQIEHLKNINTAQGIAFFIIEFAFYHEVYFLDSKFIIDAYENGEKRSIPYRVIKEKGLLIKQSINPRLDYIKVIDYFYFDNDGK